MCGIGGIYAPLGLSINDGHRKILDAIGEEMFERGPDAGGVETGAQFGLVHRRLAIIDLDERSNQPMESQDWVLAYNGEIYNFRAIRAELETRQSFRTSSDTEVLLLALQEWGLERTLERIAGMFAFLAYNKKENVFYAVRDHMGIKPLVMTRLQDGAYAFASSAAALVNAQPERRYATFKPALASFFTLGAPFTRSTVYEGIERVEPATYLRFTPDGQFTAHRYWQPQYQPHFTMQDLLDVVAEYEISDVPSALFLSGGVDSTFLAAATKNLDCFHLYSPETHYAKEVANRFGRKFVCVKPEFSNYEENMARVMQFHGEPLMSCGIPFSVSSEIAAQGYKMAISANGADELFHGYPRTPAPEATPDYLPSHETESYRWFSQQLAHIFRDSRNFDLPSLQDELPSLIDIGNEAISSFRLHDDFPPSASYRWFELMSYVLHDLNPTLDAASMLNSIEVRVPFLDKRVVEGVLSWDASRLITPQLGRKAPLKAYLSQYFPVSFFQRPKLGFSIDKELLGPIASLGQKAMSRFEAKGFISFKKRAEFGEVSRDAVYLANSCLAYDLWQKSGGRGIG